MFKEIFLGFVYLIQCQIMTPSTGQMLIQVLHDLNKFRRGPKMTANTKHNDSPNCGSRKDGF